MPVHYDTQCSYFPPLPTSVVLVATSCNCFGKYHYTPDAREDPKPDDRLMMEHGFTAYPR